jgi:ATP-binding cassette subfamily B (MDR/TAP) protein 7/ABC transporter ATM
MYGKYKQAMVNIRSTTFPVREKKDGTEKFQIEFQKNIEISGVDISADRKILLRNIAFKIKKGEKVAILGRNGSGKSTLLKYLVRIYSSEAGNMYIDGADMDDDSFRKLVSYVPQDPWLFNDTVLYNIKYGADRISNENVYYLSKEMGFHESISRLSNGYETNVGEGGKFLSGGERQKIAVLRALAKKPEIMVMDEPTSNLDKISEKDVFEKLKKHTDLTVITIVHNLELLCLFDRIFMTESGTVKELNTVQQADIGRW